ncbi:group III truncated hemoglobin [Chondrinema litorale]|uniref:group III truncated hemoglobin n=1 Tax=Chondrinema litorale TaxID=2994555 RepID=UPI0025439BB5|nr:group III truncated hemoglobin [Chondrinema litorale]UZR98903.1 group III truncated hemoglobin [Chondrinema litorale]
MKDIENNSDIQLLVDEFYKKVNEDELLSPIFNEIAQVNWKDHLPKMYKFWSKLLLGENEYQGSPFDKHIQLPIGENHFNRWIQLFLETLDAHFAGSKATEARLKAQSIANIFNFKMKTIQASGYIR